MLNFKHFLLLSFLQFGIAEGNADVPINYLRPEGSIVFADSVPRGSAHYQNGIRVEKEAIDAKKLSCSLYSYETGPRGGDVSRIAGSWHREFGSHAYATDETMIRIAGGRVAVQCSQQARSKGMFTLSEISETIGGSATFDIASDPVDEGEFNRIPNEVISFRAPSVSVWLPAQFQPSCSFWSHNTYVRPNDCFHYVPESYPVVEMNFYRNGLVHKLKHDHVYESSTIYVSFEYVRKIYDNRPAYRGNIVTIDFVDKESGSSFDSFRVRMMLPHESHIAASLEDFHLHTGGRFLVNSVE